jgi:UvrD-like helicase family protein/nuclease-like protein/AAA domain-containing protein
MVPFPMLPTPSSAERRLYEGFLQQLPDEYVVYHSVDWVLGSTRTGGPPIEGEADFVIAHPVDGLLVLEAKGGEISYDPHTRRWFQAGRGGRHHLDEDPFHQARDEMHSLVEILSHQPGWDRWKPSFGYGVAFPDGLYQQDAHPAARAAWVIDKDDMSRLADRVKEVMAEWRHPGRRFGAEGIEALQEAMGLRVEIRTPLKLRFDEDDRRIVELTNDQAYVLSYVTKRHRAAIVGPAGSGKTTLAIQTAKRVAESGKPTLLTCFNWRLAGYLRDSTAATPHLTVEHFHELCRRMAREAGLPIPDEPADETHASAYYADTLPELLAKAADVLGPRFDAMIVDEAQDFLPGWWPSLMRLHTHPDDGYLFLFADSNQNLYGGVRAEDMVDLTLQLPANLRNTKPIHEFVSVFFRGQEGADGRGPAGRPVEVLSYRDEAEEARLLALVLKNLEQEDVPLSDIVLLTPARAAKSALRRRGRVDGYELSAEPTEGKLLACTIHGFKGLERPVVILAEIGERHREDLARYLYVGGSRARSHLIILATEPVARELRQLAGVTKD